MISHEIARAVQALRDEDDIDENKSALAWVMAYRLVGEPCHRALTDGLTH